MWIGHNDLANGYDGLTDVEHGSGFITVSWNHFHDHGKNALLGHSVDTPSGVKVSVTASSGTGEIGL